MIYTNELKLFEIIMKNYHLPISEIEPASDIDKTVDLEFRENFCNGDYKAFSSLFSFIEPNTVYRIIDPFYCKYIFWQSPDTSKKVFLIGPYCSSDYTKQQILEIAEKNGISPLRSRDLEIYYSGLCVVRDESALFATVNALAEVIWNGIDSFKISDLNIENDNSFISENIIHSPETYSAQNERYVQAIEKRYQYENDLINAISHGNLQQAELMMKGFSSLAFESRTPDRLRNMKNYCIIMNTICRKAAESGGVHPIYLDAVSSDLAKKIELVTSLPAVSVFMHDMLKTYCQLTRNRTVKNYSTPVRNAIVRIDSDLTGDLTLSTISKSNNVTAPYFSSLFKKETGKTLTEFVIDRRIKLAKHLLRNSNLQIQTVSQYCGILDLHYFCRLFKKKTGITPTEYKNSAFLPAKE